MYLDSVYYEDLIMIEKIRYVDASPKDLAIITNKILKKSKKFTEQAYTMGYITSLRPRFTSESIKKFYNIGDFYEKNGEIKESAKPELKKMLKDLGLEANATLAEFKNYLLGIYK